MVMSNQPQEVGQDHQGGPLVQVLCGLKGYRSLEAGVGNNLG